MNCCDINLTKPLLAAEEEEQSDSQNNNNKKKRSSSRGRSFYNSNSDSHSSRRRKSRARARNGYSEFELESPEEFGNSSSDEESEYTRFRMGLNKDSCSLMFRRIFLLLWKNLLFKRRHYIVTGFEIILPTLCAMLMAFIRIKAPEATSEYFPNGTQYPIVQEIDMMRSASTVFSCGNCIIAYVPDNAETTGIMNDVYNKLPEPKEKVKNIEIRGFDDEEEVQVYASQATFNDTFGAIKVVIVFTGGISESSNYSPKISYKIRMVNNEWGLPSTERLYDMFQLAGPVDENVLRYVSSGFSGLQVAIDKVLIRRITKQDGPQINTQGFPYPPYTEIRGLIQFYFLMLPQFLVTGFIFMVPAVIRTVISEKQTGIKELMKMMGLPNWMHWLGWMLTSLIMLMISITIVCIIFFVSFSDKGAVLNNSDPTLWWVVLVLYAMAATSFCFFISTLFQRASLAITAGIILWFVSYYAITQLLEPIYQNLSLGIKLLSALAPNAALHWAIKAMCAFEGKAVGAHWKYLFDPISSVDELSVGWICFMFIVDTVLYMTLTIYFENIIPSEYGVRKPWYYIFKPSTWFSVGKDSSSRVSSGKSQGSTDGPEAGFETEPEGLVPSVVIDKLTKRFSGGKIAVDGISMKIYDGEITALLGHNGAGKTTTMSMLTGLFAPSNGTALIKGYDINTSMDKVRQNLGLCPQHNMLFDNLTVEEHLKFFGRLKGLRSSQAVAEIKPLLEKLQLREKRTTPAAALSGGQKRKLSLGIALIGGTKVVILDEPTSGMDPEARRAIWDLLLEMRGERTILLTTHFMEEADVLGDKIAIMASGKVKCHGTPMFLKKFYGAGYKLKITTTEQNSAQQILTIVQKYAQNAICKVQQQHLQLGNITEVEIILPNERDLTKSFPVMFAELQQSKEPFGIQTIGLSLTTMDDVFIKVGELDHLEVDSANNGFDTQDGPTISRNGNGNQGTSSLLKTRLTGIALAAEQFYGLLVKRIICTLRKRKLFFCQFFMPLLLLIATILLSNNTFQPSYTKPPLKMSLDPYKEPQTPYTYKDETFLNSYKKVIGSSAVNLPNPIVSSLMNVGTEDLAKFRERYIVGGEFNSSTNVTALFSSIPYHSSPLALNLMSSAILNSLAGGGYNIEMTIHPIESDSYSILEAARPAPVFSIIVPILFGVLIPIGLALFAATFIVYPIEERQCKAKQLQLMTGVSPIIFWSSSFLWDFCVMFVLICLMVICFPIFQSYGAFTPNGGAGVIFLILLAFGFSAISFSYLFSFVASTVAGGFSLVTIIHCVTGMLLSIAVFSMENAGLAGSTETMRWIGRPFPAFSVSIAIMRYASIATINSRCNILSQKAKDIICNPNFNIEPELRQCCDNCKAFGSCFEPKPYLKWTDTTSSFLSQNISGIGQDVFYLFLAGIIYKLLLICIEYGIITRILGRVYKSSKDFFKLNTTDEDVVNEKQRVEGLVTEARTEEEAFVVENLCKSYGSFAAVSNLSFGVHHGECFGLLGVNGAGKTTSFRMLTGDEIRSEGNAYIMKYTLENNRKAFLGSIGYCPQFDGIVGELTGREMLQMFGRLRGIQKHFVDKEADRWLHKLGLYESRDVQCRKYSGGMKRRLSAGMAMIGDCPIILLDEPTSGVDPIARRQFWEVINSVKESGQAIILTSHSMEECEALCSRLGIMVNGQFQCFGGVQHLKNKYAQGFSLVLKLKSLIPQESPELQALCDDISTRFNPSVLKDRHQNILQYQVLNTTIPWDVLFKNMEDLKMEYEHLIEDYSVNDTTLEEVFLSFARFQYPARTADVPFLKKLITCQCCS